MPEPGAEPASEPDPASAQLDQSRWFTLFDTAFGECALAWNDQGVVGFSLPERNPGALAARAARRHRARAHVGVLPPKVAHALGDVVAFLGGALRPLQDIELCWQGTSAFHLQVYEVTRAIPPGQTRSYGEVAKAVGMPHAARAVGQALGENPIPLIMPCHRVLAAGGKLGGFSAPGGAGTKQRLLLLEAGMAPRVGSLF